MNEGLNPLLAAVFQHDAATIREYTRHSPEFMRIRTPAGTLPLDLARELGNPETELALLMRGAVTANPRSEEQLKELMMDWVGWFSQNRYAASWEADIEFHLWLATMGLAGAERSPLWGSAQPPSADELRELKWLSDKLHAWPTFEGVVDIDVWGRVLNEWMEDR